MIKLGNIWNIRQKANRFYRLSSKYILSLYILSFYKIIKKRMNVETKEIKGMK